MNKRAVTHVVSALIVVVGAFIISAVPVGLLMRDSHESIWLMAAAGIIPVICGIVVFCLTRSRSGTRYELGVREGFGIVTFGWITASIFGCIPFVLVSGFYPVDAFFETMSGFTTTGASVIDTNLVLLGGEKCPGIEGLPKGLLYWRATTHWLGGMGIVVLSLAILPFLGIGGQQLYNAEVPGFSSDQLTPRIASSAKILWGVYMLLTLAETVFLCFGGMSLFDAWCQSCATMATGGFSTLQSSVGGFKSLYIEMVITVFMFLAGANFVLHYRALRGKPLFYFKDEEFRFYLALTLAATGVITISLMFDKAIVTTTGAEVAANFGNCLRYASFQVVSILTTTGFCTANFNIWPALCTFLLVILMFVGGCGGSTGGGMKNSRILLVCKYGISQIKRCIFPHSLSNIRLNHERVDDPVLHKVVSFFFLFVACYVITSLAIAAVCQMDVITAAAASIACLGNIGPGLGKVGAVETYSWLNSPAKIILTLAMLIGRLEVYTVLVIILPSFWRK